jgi:hypothetical protein
MQINLNGLLDQPVHVSGFGGKNLGFLELDAVALADAVFVYSQFVRMLQTNVLVVVLDSGFKGTASLPNVNLTTFAGYAVPA